MRRISIFGATGSIGQNTIDLISRDPGAYDVVAVTGASNIAQLAKDAKRLNAQIAVTAQEERLGDLRAALAGSGVEAAAGAQALDEAATRPVDWLMSAIVGVAGLVPSLRAAQQGACLALANKESLVAGGQLLKQAVAASGARLLPVDSEHSAVFQALIGEEARAIERVIITASGGAFRDWPVEDLERATPQQAATHPNWDMGQRITIDSASMFNKGLELIEAKELFDLKPAQIEALVHPESLVHALVGFEDGALMAHVGPADMRHAIGFALHYPNRKPLPVERLDLTKQPLSFRPVDHARYPAVQLAYDVMALGNHAGAAFNGAKEAALDAFLRRDIGFMDMARGVEQVVNRLARQATLDLAHMDLDSVRHVDHMARTYLLEWIGAR